MQYKPNKKITDTSHKGGSTVPGGKSMMSSSPEPKGTLTPPGSSPLGADSAHLAAQFTQSSAPPSPETPMTPDSAHMSVEPSPANRTECLNAESTNQEPLTGARKRKATKVHKLEPECVGRTAEGGESVPPTPLLTCNVCQAEMTSQHDFTRHIRTHNRVIEDDSNGTKLFECGLCQKQLSSNSSLDRHMLVHSGERPFRCHICGTHFTTNGNMHRHIRGHYRNGGGGSDSGDSDGGSEGGGGGGGSVSSPRKRKLEFDEEEDIPCGGKLPRLNSETYSADDEFSIPVEDISCPVCGLEQNGASGLEIHLEKEHPEHSLSLKISSSQREESSPPKAELADAASPSRLTIRPVQCHAKSEGYPMDGFGSGIHHCPTCSLPFPSVESWLLHLRDHPVLKCNLCDAKFESISEYTTHQQRHAQESSERRGVGGGETALSTIFESPAHRSSPPSIFPRGLSFPINPQQISLPNAEQLQRGRISDPSPIQFPPRHSLGTHHSHSPLSVSNPAISTLSHDEQFARDYKDMKLNGQYPCRLCKEVFANLRKLKSHNLVHMVAPPYRCNLCSFVSNDKNTLKEHMKNHKGDTPYECNLCSLSFTTKANCERHIKNIHGRQTREEVKRCMTYTPQEDGPSSQETSRETVCRLCKFDCKSRSVLRDHMRSSHPEGIDKPYSCKICHVSFQCNSDAYRHIIQAHQDAVSRESLETLVEQRSRKEEAQDLSSVESLLTFSKLSIPISSTGSKQQPVRPGSPVPHPIAPSGTITLQKVPATFQRANDIISPSLPLSAYTPPASDDVPLDLSINKRSKDNHERENDSDQLETDEEITVIDEADNETKVSAKELPFKSHTAFNYDTAVGKEGGTSSSSSSTDKLVSSPNKAFPLMYPGQLPVQFLPFQGQYPFLMNPFGTLPHVTNLQLIEQYQEFKRGLQLTSGGTLLSPDNNNSLIPSVCNSLLNPSGNRLMKPGNSSSLKLSAAMALAASHGDAPPSDENSNAEDRPQTLATDLSPSNRDADEVSHFTMRNSVLVKKPKQRRYRTERPWRCDLCDKGFTLRSNMERHMKQQHPDLWQQRLRGGGSTSQKLGISAGISRDLFVQASIETPKPPPLKEDSEPASEAVDVSKEDEESELIIDDEEEEEEYEQQVEEQNKEETKLKREDGNADLASVQKLLSTASSQSFSFFHREAEESDDKNEENSPCVSPLSQDNSSEDGKKSAYSSAPQKQKCPFCHRKFPWSSSLVRHIRTHTGQKPYLCPVCHFPFTTKSNCDRHLQRKHPDSPHALSGDRPYRCSKCPGAAFTSIESLRKHDMFKHEKANDTSLSREDFKPFGTKAFCCYLCDVRCFSQKEILQHVAETHPENFKFLHFGENPTPPSPTALKENNSDGASPDHSSPEATPNSAELVLCMLCYKRTSNVTDLKDHILSTHTYSNSEPPFSPSPKLQQEDKKDEGGGGAESEIDNENTNDKRGEKETSEFISNMLGTKPAVIDHLLSSKSAADAAKLLGVR